MRRLIGVLCLAALSAAACKESRARVEKPAQVRRPAAVPTVSPRLVIAGPEPSVDALRKASLGDALVGFDGLLRLRPDKRFLIAIAEVERILAKAPTVRLRLEFRDGHWEVFSSAQSVGTLSEFPSFGEAFALLREWSARLRARDASSIPERTSDIASTKIRGETEQFLAPHLIDSLGLVDQEWKRGTRDAGLLALAAHDLVLLNLQTLDRLELGDLLAARALAVLSLAEAFDAPDAVADKALIASSMGYGTDARHFAERLPSDDPVRLFVFHKTAELRARAEKMPDNRAAQYLALLSLADREKESAWTGWFQAHFFEKSMSLPVLHAGLRLLEFGSSPVYADAILHAWMAELSDGKTNVQGEEQGVLQGPKGPADDLLREYIERIRRAFAVKPAGLIRSFEGALQSKSERTQGVFWDGEAHRAYARASFYSALHALGLEYLDQLSSVPGTRQFAEYVQDAPPGVGEQFARWYRHRADAKSGRGDFQANFEDLAALDQLGAVALQRTLADMKNTLLWKRDAIFEVVTRLTRRLDTRVNHQWAICLTLFHEPRDLRRTERLCRNISSLAPLENPWPRAWCSAFVGATGDLLSLAADRGSSNEARAAALNYLRFDPDVPRKTVRSLDSRLLEESGYEREVVRPSIDYLELESKDYRRAREIVEKWLSIHKDEGTLLHSIYVGRRAHLLDLEKRHQEAWSAIEPEVQTWQGAILGWAAEILENLGRHSEAVDLARKRVERYPDQGEARGDLAELLWKGERFSDAAEVVWSPLYQADLATWDSSISKNFVHAFHGKSVEDVSKAFEALLAQRVAVWSLQTVIDRIAAEGRSEAAFKLEAPLLSRKGDDYFIYRVYAYRYLKSWKGKDEALSWLRGNLDEKRVEAGMPVFFELKEDDLLWDLYPARNEEWSSLTWLLRACAAVCRGLERSPHRDELLAHYRDAKPSNSQSQLGRHVLGLQGEKEILTASLTDEERSLAAYAFAVKAIGQRDYRTASDWLQLASVFEKGNGRASMLAEVTLDRWYSAGKGLDIAARQGAW
jgi:tetratricopeptide (TPR) repeat protein